MKTHSPLQRFQFPFQAMGSPCEIQLYAKDNTRATAIAQGAIAEAQRLEHRYSRYRANSVLSAINQVAAKGGRMTLDAETALLFNYAQACYQQSEGLFDITCGVLRNAWPQHLHQPPTAERLQPLLARVGWHRQHWQPPHIRFMPGTELDFGGIVKEYAADRLATHCWNAGAQQGFINLGGDIRIIGPHPDGSPWRIGIQHPRKPGQAILQTLDLFQGGIASSGDYERGFTLNGIRYSHILHPKTGWPVQHLAAVTVVADLCLVAGSAATIGMLKQHEGPQWLNTLGVQHLWVDNAGVMGGSLI